MRVCVLSYPEVLPAGLQALRAAAAKRPEVELVELAPHVLQLVLDGPPRVQVGGVDLAADVVLHRTVYPYRHLVVPALQVLAARGSVVLNDPERALRSRDKGQTLLVLSQAGLPTVPTILVAEPPAPADLLLRAATVVLKPALGAQGRGVVRAPVDELERAQQWAYDDRLGPTLVQPFLPHGSDLRAYVVDGACVVGRRTPAAGEWRCNLGLGSAAARVDDPGLERDAAALAVAAVRATGLDHAAVDLLVGTQGELLLSEVDAWGGFTGLGEAVGVDVGGQVVDLGRRRWQALRHRSSASG